MNIFDLHFAMWMNKIVCFETVVSSGIQMLLHPNVVSVSHHQTLSYNGKLTFKVAKEVAGGLAASTTRNGIQHPLVIMLGKYNLQLSYEITEPMTSGNVHEFTVTLREVRDCVICER